MSNSLQQITDAYGQWIATSNPPSGGLLFSASTDYSRISDYSQYQVSVGPPTIAYGVGNLPVATSITSAATSFNNGSDVAQSQSVTLSETTTQDFNWSTTQALSVDVTVSASMNIPGIAQFGGSVSTDMTFSTTDGGSTSKSQNWTLGETLTVPAHSTVAANLVVTCQSYDLPWTATCLLTGSVALWFNNRWEMIPGSGQHFLWFVPIQSMLAVVQQVGSIIDTTGYTVAPGGIFAAASGTFTGAQGIASQIVVTQTTHPGTANAKPLTSSFPLDADGRIAVRGADPATPLKAVA
jgi:hypothetical protein